MKKQISVFVAVLLCIGVAVISVVATSVLRSVEYEKKWNDIKVENTSLSDENESLRKTVEILKSTGGIDASEERTEALSSAMDILEEARSTVEEIYVFNTEDSEFAIDTELVEANLEAAYKEVLTNEEIAIEDIETYILDVYFSSIADPFTMYHTKEEMQELVTTSEGKLYGIGVYIYFDSENNALYVNHVMPSSPAEEAGVQVGDRILSVEGISVSEETYNDCVNAVAGELGTEVTLVISRNGEETVIKPIRGEVTTKSVYLSYKEDYAYIEIVEFSGKVYEDFKAAIEEAEAKGVKGYVFDMRSNPGGDLDIIVNVLDILLPEGPIVNIVYYNGETYTFSSDEDSIDKPMVVLCNGDTASAGELFTSALSDYKKATIIGETTYGKGTMQTILYLSDGSGIRVSYAYYNPPYSSNYHLKGITPDIVYAPTEYLANHPFLRGTDEDNQLKKAIEELDRLCSENN